MKTFIYYLLACLIMLTTFTASAYAQSMDPSAGYYKASAQQQHAQEEVQQSSSVGYETLRWIQLELKQIVEKIYTGFGDVLGPIIYLVLTLTIIGTVIGYIINSPPPFIRVVMILVTAILLQSLILDVDFFMNWIYLPLTKLMIALPTFIIESVATTKPGKSTGDGLQDMFLAMDLTIGAMQNLTQKIAENSSFLGGFMVKVMAAVLSGVYFALQVVFSYMFIIAIFSINILFVALPIAFAMAVHPKTRKYMFNILHHCLSFLITPAMAAVAMAITVGMLAAVTKEASGLKGDELKEFPMDFYWQAMFLGVMSIFLHLKATSFASMIVGTADTGFGQMFGSMLATGAMAGGAARRLGSLGVGGTKQAARFGGGLFSGAKGGGVSAGKGLAGKAGVVVGKGGRILTQGAQSAYQTAATKRATKPGAPSKSDSAVFGSSAKPKGGKKS